MLCSAIGAKARKALSSDAVLGKHTLDSERHSKLGLGSHKRLVGSLLESSDVAGVYAMELLSKLISCQNCLLAVDNDNEFAAIDVRRELGAMLTSEDRCDCCSGPTERLICSINYIPLALNGLFLCHISGHAEILHE